MYTIKGSDPTAHLVALTLSTKGTDIGEEAEVAAKSLLIDTVACAVGSSTTGPGRAVRRFSRAVHNGHGASNILDGDDAHRLDPAQAAFVNGHLANVLDADETLLNRSHFASAVVPAAIAVAQAAGTNGQALLEAIVVGYEVAARVGIGMPHFTQDDEGAVRHVLAGNSAASFGAAAAAGRLLQLSPAQMEHAFGITGKSAPVHFTWGDVGAFAGYFDSTTVPGLHKYGMYGVLARCGVEAAYLAREGYTAAPKQFAPEREFWKSFGAHRFNYDSIFDAPSLNWWVRHSALKPWPTCRFGHVALSLLEDVMLDSQLRMEEITSIEVLIPSFPFLQLMGETKDPDVPEKLVFSLPMALAVLASKEAPGPHWWAPDVFHHAAVRELADRTRVTSDASLAEPMHSELGKHGGYYSIPTRLTVNANGKRFTASGSRAKGDPRLSPEDPDMSIDLAEKFANFTREVLGSDQSASLYRQLLSIEDNDDVQHLFGRRE